MGIQVRTKFIQQKVGKKYNNMTHKFKADPNSRAVEYVCC